MRALHPHVGARLPNGLGVLAARVASSRRPPGSSPRGWTPLLRRHPGGARAGARAAARRARDGRGRVPARPCALRSAAMPSDARTGRLRGAAANLRAGGVHRPCLSPGCRRAARARSRARDAPVLRRRPARADARPPDRAMLRPRGREDRRAAAGGAAAGKLRAVLRAERRRTPSSTTPSSWSRAFTARRWSTRCCAARARGRRAARGAARRDPAAASIRTRCRAGSSSCGGGRWDRREPARCSRAQTSRPRTRCGPTRCAPTPQALVVALAARGVSAAPRGAARGGHRRGAFDAHGSSFWREGALMPQSRASMMVAHCLGPASGERVLDICAAPEARPRTSRR